MQGYQQSGRRASVMIVEDDADIRSTLSQIIYDEGHDVMEAANGREAMRLLERSTEVPDLILLDMNMPVMDGWMFRAMQTRVPAFAAIPTVVVSAHDEVATIAATIAATDFIRKPLDLDALLEVLARYCGERHAGS